VEEFCQLGVVVGAICPRPSYDLDQAYYGHCDVVVKIKITNNNVLGRINHYEERNAHRGYLVRSSVCPA
jgi:hypothetical protein